MRQRREHDLGKDKVFSLVLQLAIPTMLAQLINVLYSVVDRMFIGHIPELALTHLLVLAFAALSSLFYMLFVI